MNDSEKYTEKKLIHEKLAYQYFLKLRNQVKPSYEFDAFHILTNNEIEAIRLVERTAYGIAALYGVLGVVLLYIPYWLYPNLFPSVKLELSFLDEPFDFPWAFSIYGFVLVFIELAALTLLNLWVVHKIAVICKFPVVNDPFYEDHTEALFVVGMEKESKRVLSYGINPLAGVSKLAVMAYTALFLLKATLSNLFMKFILKRVTGRLAIRAYVDLIGIPVFAFWNAYATYLVIKRAKIRIMASSLVKRLNDHLRSELGLCRSETFKSLIYDTLQFVAENKRDFHYNHYLLASILILEFDLPVKKLHKVDKKAFFEKMSSLEGNEKEGFLKMFLFGMLIDGHISRREVRVVDRLYQDGLIHVQSQQMKDWVKQFIKGEGLDSFFNTKVSKEEPASFDTFVQ